MYSRSTVLALVSVLLVAGCAAERAAMVAPIVDSGNIATTPLATELGVVAIGPPTFTAEGFRAIVIDDGVEKEVELACNGRSVLTRIDRPGGFYESRVTPRLRSFTAFARTQTDSMSVFAPRHPNGESSGPEVYTFNGIEMMDPADFAEDISHSTLAGNNDARLLKAVLESPDLQEWAADNASRNFEKKINWKKVGQAICAAAAIGTHVCIYFPMTMPCIVIDAVGGACLAQAVADLIFG